MRWKENVELYKFVSSEMYIFRYEYELCCRKDTGCESGQSRVETCDVTHLQKPILILYFLQSTRQSDTSDIADILALGL